MAITDQRKRAAGRAVKRARLVIGAAWALAGGGCWRGRPAPTPDQAPSALSAPADPTPAAGGLALPDVPGFAAGSPETGEGFVRRTYTRGPARLQVTLARMPMSTADYQRWVSASVAFPQADLGLPGADANGFYQCGEGVHAGCDLLIQLQAGLHLELRGGGTSSRADVDALARGLPLRAWAR